MKQENPICGIYRVTSPKKYIYVGQSINIKRRKKEYHRLENCKGQLRLYNSLKKYGWKAHKFEIIHLCKESQLNKLEIHYIKFFNSFNTSHGLNLTSGGSQGKRSEETKAKMLGKNNPMHGKVSPMKGKTWEELYGLEKTKEMKKDLRETKLGKNNPMYGKIGPMKDKKHTPEVIESMSGKNNPQYGKPRAQETKDKISKTLLLNPPMLNKHHTKKTRKLLSIAFSGENNPNYGKVWSEETNKKRSESLKGKTYDELYGIKKSKEIRKIKSEVLKGKTWEELHGIEKAKKMKKELSETMKKLNKVV